MGYWWFCMLATVAIRVPVAADTPFPVTTMTISIAYNLWFDKDGLLEPPSGKNIDVT